MRCSGNRPQALLHHQAGCQHHMRGSCPFMFIGGRFPRMEDVYISCCWALHAIATLADRPGILLHQCIYTVDTVSFVACHLVVICLVNPITGDTDQRLYTDGHGNSLPPYFQTEAPQSLYSDLRNP